MDSIDNKSDFRILSLDGGGSKGIYTLGILEEFEKYLNTKLCEYFHLIYGTSTGAIIGSLLALGYSVLEIKKMYLHLIPKIMKPLSRNKRSKVLVSEANNIFHELTFADFKTRVGIVSTEYEFEKPLIFKTDSNQIYSQKASFVPGFGCRIVDAVISSSAAFPFFNKYKVETQNKGSKELIDGGFVANNPTLFAIIDATQGYSITNDKIKILNLGVGQYPEKSGLFSKLLMKLWPIELLQKTFNSNSNTLAELVNIVYGDIRIIRISDSFTKQKYSTNLLEYNIDKLNTLYKLGIESFGRFEKPITECFIK